MNGYVEMITGTLGSGKTLLAVERAYEHVRNGGYVYGNVAFRPDQWERTLRERDHLRFDPSRLVQLTAAETLEFHRHVPRGTRERPVMVIVDEAGLEFNARDWAKTDRDLLALNTLARKLELIVLYVSQQSADMDKQFRGKCRAEWQCRRPFNRRIMGMWQIDVPLFFRVCYDVSKGKRERVCYDVVPPPKWVYPLYDSDALVGRGHEALSGMAQVTGTPLERIEVPDETFSLKSGYLPLGALLCASAFGFSFF